MGSFSNDIWRWNLQWRRRLYEWEQSEVDEVLEKIQTFRIKENEEDMMMWTEALEPFSTSRCLVSLEKASFTNLGSRIPNVWNKLGAPKWQAFMWLAYMGKILSKRLLVRIGLIGNEEARCAACGEDEEDSDHILLSCRIAWRVWSLVMSRWGFNWVQPKSMGDIFEQWDGYPIPKKWAALWNVILFSTSWSIWLGRNDRIFRNGDRNPQDMFMEGLIHGVYWAKQNDKNVWMDGLDLLPT